MQTYIFFIRFFSLTPSWIREGIVFFFLLIIPSLALAENETNVAKGDSTSSGTPSSLPSSSSLSKIPVSAVATIPTQAPPAPEQDRNNNSGAAIALAAVGAAISGASCMMLMQQAKKEPNEATKKMLMSQALQQCAQAAQSAANAAQNQKGRDQVRENNKGEEAQLKTEFAQSEKEKGKSSGKEELFPYPFKKKGEQERGVASFPPSGEKQEELSPGVVAASDFNFKDFGEDKTQSGKTQQLTAMANSWSTLSPLNHKSVQFDDGAKVLQKPEVNSPGSSLASFTRSGSTGMQASATLSNTISLSSQTKEEKGRGKIRRVENEGGEEGGSSFSSGQSSSKNSSGAVEGFDGLFSSLFGDAKDTSHFPFSGGEEILRFPSTERGARGEKGKLPNIFQYAAYQFQKLTKEEDRITHRL